MTRAMLLAVLAVALVGAALVGGIPVLQSNRATRIARFAGYGEGFAVGVFLGAGLVHMLSEAQVGFTTAGTTYPWAFVICGGALIAFWGLEYLHTDGAAEDVILPVISTTVLAVHSFLAGAVLGATEDRSTLLALTLALAAHKTVAAFAIATLLARSPLSTAATRLAFGCFVVALPVGIIAGEAIMSQRDAWPLAVPITMALGAGTFLCLATRHGHHESRHPPVARWCAAIAGYLFTVALVGFV